MSGSGPGPQTSWEDLANLGWFRQQVYNACNARRGGTMEGMQDIALNETFAHDWSWFSYNVLIGEPRIKLQAFEANWTETWTNSTSASLSITNHSSISLSQSITIMNVATSEFAMTIATDSTREETRTTTDELSTSWGITVQGGETVHVERVRTAINGRAIYEQEFGLNLQALVANALKGMRLNDVLVTPPPRGRRMLRGLHTQESFVFRIVRISPDGRRRVEPLPPPEGIIPPAVMSEKCGAKYPKMVPGLEKK
ncbi:cytolysin [Mycena alexandri]|uniref:Cytolysin n=1 Tax=Mycena alexandri TaxID=1745969 RepID=A0AAD6S7N4_9AGAR|nr:cytolysin [Mycena alexandri]